jgi:hypothetical protein
LYLADAFFHRTMDLFFVCADMVHVISYARRVPISVYGQSLSAALTAHLFPAYTMAFSTLDIQRRLSE